MGIETALIIGAALFQAHSSISQAEEEAKAVVREGELAAQNKANETRLKAARQQVSFLNSGLLLEGTPMASIQSTFDTGIADTNQIISNANTRSKNIIRAGRSEAIGKLVEAGVGAGMGSGDLFGTNSIFGNQGAVSRTIEMGNPTAQGPIKGFGGLSG